MKKIITMICMFIVVLTTASFVKMDSNDFLSWSSTLSNQNLRYYVMPIKNFEDKLCNDIFISLLYPYTQKSVENFYSRYLKEIPGADPNFDRIINVERIGGDGHLEYLIKIETSPYVGPHITVGTDHITFRINALGEVSLEKFEHIESDPIPPHYHVIIKSWPPQ